MLIIIHQNLLPLPPSSSLQSLYVGGASFADTLPRAGLSYADLVWRWAERAGDDVAIRYWPPAADSSGGGDGGWAAASEVVGGVGGAGRGEGGGEHDPPPSRLVPVEDDAAVLRLVADAGRSEAAPLRVLLLPAASAGGTAGAGGGLRSTPPLGGVLEAGGGGGGATAAAASPGLLPPASPPPDGLTPEEWADGESFFFAAGTTSGGATSATAATTAAATPTPPSTSASTPPAVDEQEKAAVEAVEDLAWEDSLRACLARAARVSAWAHAQAAGQAALAAAGGGGPSLSGHPPLLKQQAQPPPPDAWWPPSAADTDAALASWPSSSAGDYAGAGEDDGDGAALLGAVAAAAVGAADWGGGGGGAGGGPQAGPPPPSPPGPPPAWAAAGAAHPAPPAPLPIPGRGAGGGGAWEAGAPSSPATPAPPLPLDPLSDHGVGSAGAGLPTHISIFGTPDGGGAGGGEAGGSPLGTAGGVTAAARAARAGILAGGAGASSRLGSAARPAPPPPPPAADPPAAPVPSVRAAVHRVPASSLRTLRRLGTGAFGEVALCACPVFGPVAVKWLKDRAHTVLPPSDGEAEGGARRGAGGSSFWREASMLAGLNHQNTLRFFAVAVADGWGGGGATAGTPLPSRPAHRAPIVGILTEHCAGGSLAAYLRRREGPPPPTSPASSRRAARPAPPPGTIPLRLRAALALGAARGLAYLHAMRVVHLDLKPENLLLDAPLAWGDDEGEGGQSVKKPRAVRWPRVKVADFGLARVRWAPKGDAAASAYVAPLATLAGTLPYMAPELVADPGHVSDRADVWSLGVVMWELAVRCPPHADLGPSAIVAGLMSRTLTLADAIPPWIEPAWVDLMEACWEVVAADRPTAAAVAARLGEIVGDAVI